MSDIDEIMSSLPIDQIAAELGVDPTEVQQAANSTLPALLGGMQANAADPAGAASLAAATKQHDPLLLAGGVQLADIDQQDGAAIAHHIFGAEEDQVVSKLGAASGNNDLIRKLIPILAPIVMAYLAKKLMDRQEKPAERPDEPEVQQEQEEEHGGGLIGDLLDKILGGGKSSDQGQRSGGLLGDLLDGLLGRGRR